MKKITVNSDRSLTDALNLLSEIYEQKRYIQLTIDTGKKRSLPQNAIGHAWYLQVSRTEHEFTPEEVKCLCKFHFGLPILRGDDEEFNAICEAVIDPLPYESQIKAMIYFPVTSLMKTKQKAEYLETVQRNYAGRVKLLFPKDK